MKNSFFRGATLIAFLLSACARGISTNLNGGIEDILQIEPILSPKVQNNLVFVYDGMKREIPYCLQGLKNSRNQTGLPYLVVDLSLPLIVGSKEGHAEYIPKSCYSPFYLGIVHNHTNGHCGWNETDSTAFHKDKRAVLFMMVCKASIKEDSLWYYFKIKNQFKEKDKTDITSSQ